MQVQRPRLVTLYPSEPAATRTLTASGGCRSPPRPSPPTRNRDTYPTWPTSHQEASVAMSWRGVIEPGANQLKSRTLTPCTHHSQLGLLLSVSAFGNCDQGFVISACKLGTRTVRSGQPNPSQIPTTGPGASKTCNERAAVYGINREPTKTSN